MSFMEFQPATEEEVAEQRQQMERARMRGEEINHRIRRMLAEELAYDQLEALHALLAHISNSSNPSVMANWYEGMAWGAMSVRDIMLGEKPVNVDEV